uniref:WGS project CAEQ00000000 data, annotated contig 1248 n=1 Tax=Trypanosoma congolense (strain IL3000) TaxID=1068625 RepID=F9W4X9_TRYCI|nr:unnamed protein product [Trypanosoma congolense IL3000]
MKKGVATPPSRLICHPHSSHETSRAIPHTLLNWQVLTAFSNSVPPRWSLLSGTPLWISTHSFWYSVFRVGFLRSNNRSLATTPSAMSFISFAAATARVCYSREYSRLFQTFPQPLIASVAWNSCWRGLRGWSERNCGSPSHFAELYGPKTNCSDE